MSLKVKLRHFFNRLRFYLSFLLLGFYLTIGFLFLFTDTWVDLLPKGRIIIGIVLILFGSLRFYVSYRRYIRKLLKISAAHKAAEEKKTSLVKDKQE